MPVAVANNRFRLSHRVSSCGKGSTVVIVSEPSSGSRFTSALPFAVGPASGKRHTFSRNALPPEEKNNTN